MFGIPRCREWTPLATQQLRLRSLIQIVGYNIRPPEWCTSQCSFYLTLHQTTMSAPFYTSEKISSPHPKWKEIDAEVTQSLSATNTVVRIWCHIPNPHFVKTKDCQDKPNEIVIQTWGVYFSGLRYLGANLASNFNADCFKSNTLVFQMNGGYFCCYKSLKLDIIPTENEMEYGSQSSDSSGKTNVSRTDTKDLAIHRSIQISRSISPSKLYKKHEKEKTSNSLEKTFKQNFPTMRTSSSLNIRQSNRHVRSQRDLSSEKKQSNSNEIFEHSPENDSCDKMRKNPSHEEMFGSNIDLSETAENYDLRNESSGVPKFRYYTISFLKSEIRPSYNAAKLQKLHLLQYAIKKRQEAMQEIKEKIYKKSALSGDWSELDNKVKLRSKLRKSLFCCDDSESLVKEMSQNELASKNGILKKDAKPVISNGPRLTLKLNDLLSFKSKPSPFQRSEHIRLTKQLEILRFKRKLLLDERDSKMANIRRLKERRNTLFEENQDVGSELMENYHALSKSTEQLKEAKISSSAMRELAATSHAELLCMRCQLLSQLYSIFYIEQKENSTWKILNVPLPICGDESPRLLNPVSDSVAAGFVAQAACLAASLLNQPLRYKITLLGSASKILDITPDLPDPNIPMFARGGDVTLFRYGMFLLNKCIAQLLWGRGLHVTDMRPTLSNLERLLVAPNNLSDTSKLFGTYRWLPDSHCSRAHSLRSLVACEKGKHGRQFNRFKDSIDGQSPECAMNLRKQSRSVGSYNNDRESPSMEELSTSAMGSEPNIYDAKLATTSSPALLNLKIHSSDPEFLNASTYNEVGNVYFTLGENETLVNLKKQKLVKMSSNNDEMCPNCLDHNVKNICTEINNLCLNNINNDSARDFSEGFDIAKHMKTVIRSTVDVEEIGSIDCESCENNVNGVCDIVCAKNVKEVIVIPSAEAIIDTGQITLDDVLN